MARWEGRRIRPVGSLAVTIRRFVPDAAARQPLGRLEVSIDDLNALLTLLQNRDDIDDVRVEFGEGDFTDASEMRELSDSDLGELRVKTRDLVVHLSPSRAEVVGKKELADFVRDAWARSRQTNLPQPGTTWASRNLVYAVVDLGWFGLATFLAHRIITRPQEFPGWPPTVSATLIVVTFAVMIAFTNWTVMRERRSKSWALIQPLTAHELRQMRNMRSVVPLWSLLVAVAAFIASTLLGVLALISK